MIKIDVSRALPVSALRHLIALIPGFSSLAFIALGNPTLAAHLIAQLQIAVPFGKYATLFAMIFLAFLAGVTFFNFVLLIQYLLQGVYGPLRWVKEFLRARALLPLLNHLLKIPIPQPNSPAPKPKPRWLMDLRARTIQQVFSPEATTRAVFRWWHALAAQLFRIRYGLKDDDLAEIGSWQPMVGVLTTPTREELRGSAMMIAMHATGWSALAASRFAPTLRVPWFYLFAFFLIGTGLLHDFGVARLRNNPLQAGALHLRALLREFPKPRTEQASKAEENADEE
jgi:hypothetical protein